MELFLSGSIKHSEHSIKRPLQWLERPTHFYFNLLHKFIPIGSFRRKKSQKKKKKICFPCVSKWVYNLSLLVSKGNAEKHRESSTQQAALQHDKLFTSSREGHSSSTSLSSTLSHSFSSDAWAPSVVLSPCVCKEISNYLCWESL